MENKYMLNLADDVIDCIGEFRAKKMSADDLNAVANGVGKVIQAYRLSNEYQRLRANKLIPVNPFLETPVVEADPEPAPEMAGV